MNKNDDNFYSPPSQCGEVAWEKGQATTDVLRYLRAFRSGKIEHFEIINRVIKNIIISFSSDKIWIKWQN